MIYSSLLFLPASLFPQADIGPWLYETKYTNTELYVSACRQAKRKISVAGQNGLTDTILSILIQKARHGVRISITLTPKNEDLMRRELKQLGLKAPFPGFQFRPGPDSSPSRLLYIDDALALQQNDVNKPAVVTVRFRVPGHPEAKP